MSKTHALFNINIRVRAGVFYLAALAVFTLFSGVVRGAETPATDAPKTEAKPKPKTKPAKVWFITGTSSGFGLETTKAALARGDSVAATALDPAVHAELKKKYGDKVLPLRLDVTKQDEVNKAVADAVKHFGRLDVVVNNAGVGFWGAVEELSVEDFQRQFDVNFFGSLRVIHAVLPVLNKQKSGHIIQISSIAGHMTFRLGAAYSSSKWAVEALNESLAGEVASAGIKVSLVEPGPFNTGFYRAITYAENPQKKYAPAKKRDGGNPADWFPSKQEISTAQLNRAIQDGTRYESADIVAKAVLKVADAKKPPLRVIVGKGCRQAVEKTYQRRLKGWKEWDDAQK
jgi:NAD(P)-dependent dehydrogenase (short-subunit alcohol dehydrogenase family)